MSTRADRRRVVGVSTRADYRDRLGEIVTPSRIVIREIAAKLPLPGEITPQNVHIHLISILQAINEIESLLNEIGRQVNEAGEIGALSKELLEELDTRYVLV